MKTLRLIALPGLLLVAGCAMVAGPAGMTTPAGKATLSLLPQVQGGSYRTQSVITGYAQADINHLQLKLFKVVSGSEQAVLGSGGTQLTLDLPQASLSAQVTIANLSHDTTYRVRAYAYTDAGTSNLISTTDASSSVDVVVARNDRPTLATVPVQLIDKIFDGQATASSVVVTDGDLTHTGTEGMGSAPQPDL